MNLKILLISTLLTTLKIVVPTVDAQITGASSVQPGATASYFYEAPPASVYGWVAINGSVVSSNANQATVVWGSSGTGTLQYKDHGTVVATKSVTIVSCPTLTPGSISGPPWVCYNEPFDDIFNTSSASGGDGSYAYQWQESSNGSTWSNISGANSTTYNPGSLTSRRYYRRRVTSCSQTKYSNTVEINVLPDWNAGSIGGTQTICYNAIPNSLTNSVSPQGADNDFDYQWQQLAGGNWTNISGATGSTFSPGNLTSTTTYRRRVSAPTCGSEWRSSNTITITVRPEVSPGSISGGMAVCSGSAQGTFSSVEDAEGGDNNFSYQWEYRPEGGSWNEVQGAEDVAYNPSSHTITTEYRRRVSSCNQTKYSNTVVITVYPLLNPGSIGNAQTVCYNGNPSALTNTASASGGNGSISYQWQYSLNGTSGWTDLGGEVNATYNPPALTANRWYRRRAISCSETKYTNTIKITVYPSLNPGNIGNAQTVCYNGNPAILTNTASASGGNGSISYQWQVSLNGTSGWTDLGGEVNATYDPPALTADRWYRRRAISCGETKYTNTIKITVYPTLNPGSIGNAQTLCYNGNPSTLTNTASASGGDGSISYQWQYSLNGTSGWTDLSGEVNGTYNPPVLTADRWYRRRAISCGETKYTNTIKITVYPTLNPGSIGNAQTVCYNEDPASLTNAASASGGDGILNYQWQYSLNGTSGWTDLGGEVNATYDPPALTTDRWYRRRAISCSETKYTNTIKITVYPTLNPGSIGNAQTVCYNEDPASLTNTASASGGDGILNYQWQYSLNGTSGWTDLSGEVNGTYNPPVLTADRWYRRRAISCGETKYTNTIKITVYPTLNPGSIGNAQTVCYNEDPASLTNAASASGGDGILNYQWQYSLNGTSGWTDLGGEVNATYNPSALTADRWYRRHAISCGETKYTNTIKITVYPTLNPGSIGNAQTLCYNGNPSTLTNTASASGGDGSIGYQWQYSLNGTSGWTDLSGEVNGTYNPPALTANRWYRRRAISCGETKYTNTIKITIHADLTAGSISGIQSICYNSAPATLGNITSASGGGAGLSYQWQESTNGTSFTDVAGTGATYDPGTLTSDRWYRRGAYTNDCSITYTSSVKVTVDQSTIGGNLIETVFNDDTVEVFGMTDVNLQLLGEVGDIIRWQSKTTGGWNNISNTTDSYSEINVSEPTYYRVEVKNGECSTDYSNEVFINVLQVPSLDLGVQPQVRPGTGTTITADAGHANYQWFKDDVAVQNGASNQLVVTHPGKYRVTVTSNGGATFPTGNATIIDQLDISENAVVTYFYRTPVTNADDPYAFDIDEQSISAQVYDGLGRPVQQVSLYASPLVQDIVVPAEYDEFGRQTKSYLPYVEADVSSINKTNALAATYSNSDHYDYYVNTSTHATSKAFSETLLEASPLSRPIEQGAPGDAWQLGQHTVKYQYDVADSAEVILWKFENLLTANKTVYGGGQLYKNTTTDEDGNQTIQYTDKQGKTILKKSQVDASTWAATYYIYDIYGQLGAVLPPEATARLDSEFFGQSLQTRKDFLNRWAFLYNYDGRNRMTVKKVPGADSVFMVYDRWDRLVLTQDGVQRTTNAWLFTKYDQLNRPILTGIMNGGGVAAERAAVAASTVRYDTLNATLTLQYSNQSYPTSNIAEYLTVTYYDTYAFDDQASWSSLGLDFNDPESELIQNMAVKGQVTGTMTKVGDGSWIYSISYYDDKYRMIQTCSTNHLGGADAVTNYYDFIGQVNRSISSHSDGGTTTTITRSFVYDHAGRLLETWHRLNSEDSVQIAQNNYNELGEQIEKDLHGRAGGAFAQSLDYAYNIRGWLTSMNDSDLSTSGDGDLFGFNLAYDESDGDIGNSVLYNGNISAMKWSTFNDNLSPQITERSYAFSYDNLNRLKSTDAGRRWGSWGTNSQHYETTYAYDLNGNINALTRKPLSTAYMDDLSYTYAGNQLQKVSDAAADTTGFYDGYTGSIDYTYDANGNMVKDRNKDIDSIYYNHLNLPIIVDFETAGDSITYLYDAAGIKLQQTVYNGGNQVKVTDYIGEFIYETDTLGTRQLQLIQHEEGRIIPLLEFILEIPVDATEIEVMLPFDGNANDLSGNSNNATVYGGAILTNGHDGEANGAYKLDGNDDYLEIADNSSLDFGSGDFTVAFWVEKNQATAGLDNKMGVNKWNTGASPGSNEWHLNTGAQNNDIPGFHIESGNSLYSVNATTSITTGTWTHLIGMRKADSILIYVNGVIEGATYIGNVAINNVTGRNLLIGRVPQGYNSASTFDEINIYSRALSQQEISALADGVDVGEKVPKPQIAGYDYQYHLKDHLGNVRMTFSTTPENYTMVENFETGQENGWQDLHRSTNSNANSTVGGDEVELLQSGQTGAMIFLTVNKGDTLDLSVNANYESAPSNNNFLGTVYGTLFTSFDNVYGSGAEGGVSSSSTVFDDALNGGDMGGKDDASTAPRAFLNYIFFDKSMSFVSSGFAQISTAALGIGVHELISLNDLIPEADGYILAYLSNENQEAVNVHFDDFTVYHGKTNVVSTQDYYPFGLTFNESVRVASVGQRFKYNGKELQGETGWLDYGARMYQPEIGRWNAIDPLAEKYRLITPYNYVANNPLSFIDINGEDIKNPDKYVLSNKKFIRKLKQFDRALARIAGVEKSSYNLIITGGDRFSKNGKAYSRTNKDEVVTNSVDGSFHLQENGATGVDFRRSKFSDEQLKAAAKEVGLQFQGGYEDDGHWHLESEDQDVIDSYKNDPNVDKDFVPTDSDLNDDENSNKEEAANNEADPKHFLFNQLMQAVSTNQWEMAQILADQLNDNENQ